MFTPKILIFSISIQLFVSVRAQNKNYFYEGQPNFNTTVCVGSSFIEVIGKTSNI